MNRLQKKCLIVSSAAHALMIGLILFGAALVPESKSPPVTLLKVFVIPNVTDGPTHGGTPVEQQAPPPAAATQTQPTPPPQAEPQKVETPSKPIPARKPEPVKPEKSDFTFVVKSNTPVRPLAKNTAADDAKAAKKASDEAKAAKLAADAQRNRVDQISRNIKSLGDGITSSPKVQISGNGDGGESAANYRDLVASIYTEAWNPPASLDDDSAVVTVSVTIARDGRVVAHRITKTSGNRSMDASIERTLSNVTEIRPFPPEAKDAERTYQINFSLAAKRSMG